MSTVVAPLPIPCVPLCGIYALTRRGIIVYVGQSVNALSRLGSHLDDKEKSFDGAYMLEKCSRSRLDQRENFYIHRHHPLYNKKACAMCLYWKGWPTSKRFNPELRPHESHPITEYYEVGGG